MPEIEDPVPVSRRAALGASGVAAAAFVLQGMRPALAETATPAAPAVPHVVQEWIDAWNSDDPAGSVAALYTPDGVYEDAPTGTSNETTGANVANFVGSFVHEVSEVVVELRSAAGSGDVAFAEWDRSFRYSGELPGVPRGSGQQVVTRGVTIFDLAGDKIRRSVDYYDRTPLLEAIGLLPVIATPAP